MGQGLDAGEKGKFFCQNGHFFWGFSPEVCGNGQGKGV